MAFGRSCCRGEAFVPSSREFELTVTSSILINPDHIANASPLHASAYPLNARIRWAAATGQAVRLAQFTRGRIDGGKVECVAKPEPIG
jgi:hypothetical protein